MKAMVLEEFKKPMEWRDVPEPELGPQEVLVEVKANGLCATDLKVSDGLVPTVKLPLIPGHEAAGVVAKIGPEVTSLEPGDHVTINVQAGCRSCDACRMGLQNHCRNAPRTGFELNGGFADYMKAAEPNAVKIDASVPMDEASIIPGAVGCVYHSMMRRARVRASDTVLVVGIGGLGIHALQIGKIMGARVIAADIAPDKVESAKDFGAEVINSAENDLVDTVKQMTGGEGVDVVVECAGGPRITEILRQCMDCVRTGGRLVVLGYTPGYDLAIESSMFIYSQVTIIGSRSSGVQDLVEAVRLVERGDLKPVVSGRYPLGEVNEALEVLRHSAPLGRIVAIS